MKRNDKELGQLIDRAAAGIRNELLDQTAVDSAAGRAWARIAAEFADAAPATAAAQSANMRGCADFQSLITPYLKHELSSARTLLFEDHTHECVPCRRALKDARSGARLAPTMAADTFNKAGETLLNRPAARWAVAASVVLVFGLAMVPLMRRLTPLGGGLDPIVQAVDGAVFSIDDARAEAIGVGTTLKKGERIRTAKEGGAIVRLPDGSLVEMRERSEFSVSANGAGTTIHLERGSVIVQAAKQRAGHLFVATDDCLVSVTGTVFSVNSGTKGSRVSVIEGEVHVNHGNAKDVLRPGDQVSTRNNLERVSVEQEVAWSRDAERYQKALAGLQELRSDLASNVPVPGVRYSTRLLDAVPAQTALYAALPNLSNTIVESYRVLQEQIGKHEALREWWGREEKTQQQQVEGRSGDARAQQVIEKIRQFGSYLGEEIVVSVGVDAGGKPGAPLVIAELKDAAGFKYALESELRNVGGSTNQGEARVKFVADPLAQNFDGAQGEGALYVWIRDDLFAASPVHDQLKQLAINLASPQANSFKNTAFYARLADVYRDGAGLVVGADLQQILAHSLAEPAAGEERRARAMDQLGVTNLQHFILELKEKDGRGSNRAVISFNEPRRGMASWLAAPGPMGALEFISPDANMVAAFVVKDPVALVDDLLGALQTIDPALGQHLATFERENNLNVRRDFAAPLGGEFAFAVDGPVLPSPSWKMIFEVNDTARLQQTFEQIVERLNALSAREGRRGFQWERAEGTGGRMFYTLKSVDFGLEVSYAYMNGYLVMTPNRALLDRAMRYHDSQVTLVSSPKFTAALPADGNANFSALFYHNLAPLVQPLARQVAQAASGAAGGDERAMLSSLASVAPTLAYAYAQGDQIIFSANTDQGAFGLNPASFLGATGSFGLQHIFDEAARGRESKKQ